MQIDSTSLSGMFPQAISFSTQTAGLVQLDGTSHTATIGGGWNYYEIDFLELRPASPLDPPLLVDPTPVNPQATREAGKLLAFLSHQYGKVTLSGQQELNESSQLLSTVGEFPAIVTADLIDYSPSRIEYGVNPGNYVETYIAAVRDKGCLLSVMWHWNAPADLYNTEENRWWSGFYTRATGFNIADVLSHPDEERYNLLIRDIDAIAIQLKKFQNADMPILWRPLHEAEGGWFWWGAQGPQALVDLWRLLYNRLTHHHGIHNLIWVFTVENPASHDWYPGDDYVDIVGRDAYPQDMGDTLTGTWEAMLNEFDGRKIIALTEFGGVPAIDKMQAQGVWWAYFSSWLGDNGPFSSRLPESRLTELYTSPGITTLKEILYPSGESLFGPSSVIPVLDQNGLIALKVKFSPEVTKKTISGSYDLIHWVPEYWPHSPVQVEPHAFLLPVFGETPYQYFWQIRD